jgi:hypothetical protein
VIVERKIVEQIGDIDVELVADRDDAGEADSFLGSPFNHGGGERA